MIFDIHTHIGGFLGDNSFNPGNFRKLRTNLFLKAFGVIPGDVTLDTQVEQQIADIFLQRLKDSSIDKAVVLALDHAYTSDGQKHAGSRYAVANDYVRSVVQQSDKALFGCSVHPYRRDAEDALNRAVAAGAVLVKWIPSTQNIDPSSRQCRPFFELLRGHGLPLLTHTGCEHTLHTFSQRLNAPRLLETALKTGVTVIAAHCGAQLMPYEKNYFREWAEMTSRYENLYGDISAFSLPLRYLSMQKIARSEHLMSRILYGSDYPALSWPVTFLPALGPQKVRRLAKITNPLQRNLETVRALNLPETVFTNAGSLLRMV